MPKSIPKEFWPYFWDVNPEKIDPEKDSLWVIQRLLDWHNFSGAKWVLANYDRGEIQKSLTSLRSWSKRSANFWATYFRVPKAKVLCLQRASPQPPAGPWRN